MSLLYLCLLVRGLRCLHQQKIKMGEFVDSLQITRFAWLAALIIISLNGAMVASILQG
jgi:Mn2+/Fe2+ NRAMP family transporter